MSEEVKNAEGTESAAGESQAAKKKKKINKLTKDELMKKISEIETGKAEKSTYYRHLMIRKRELKIS